MTKAKITTNVSETMDKVKTERAMQAENNLAGAAVKPQIPNPIGDLTPEERRMILSNRAGNIRSEIHDQTEATVEKSDTFFLFIVMLRR